MKVVFSIKSRRAVVSGLVSAIIIAACCIGRRSLAVPAVMMLLFWFLGCFYLKETALHGSIVAAGYGLWFAVCAFVTLFLSQLIQNESVFDLPLRQVLLGFICCSIPMLFLFSVTLRPRLSGLLCSGILLAFSTVNLFVYTFRGAELCPTDFLSLGTAANVADKYTYSLQGHAIYAWLLFALWVNFSLCLPPLQVEKRKIWRTVSVSTMIAFCLLFSPIRADIPTHYFLHAGSYKNGFLLNYVFQIKESIVHKPENYSPEQVTLLHEGFSGDSENKRTPDIIVIMDEAYSDLGVLGHEINTSVPVSPFVDSLRENTIRGYALSSVYGGSTPNSEYEFLTGNSLLFVKGVVYQQYLRQPSYSIVSWLKDRGYTAIAMHPYLANGWRREKVWPNLQFDKCMFLEAFPQKNLLRGLVSDREMFEVLLDEYSERTEVSDDPIFIFGVTMQNHSAYDYSGEDFENYIKLVGYEEDYPEVEQFLTLIHETDSALEYLIHRLESMNRDIVVLVYGDHQPAVSRHFIEEVHGSELNTLDENQLLQKIPFFIWTNYTSDEAEMPLTSLNYLSGYVFDKAGMELPAYSRFIRNMEQYIPAMNARGYYSEVDGRFKILEEAEGIEKEMLQRYWTAQYNSMFDLENLDQVFFPLNLP